MGAVAAAISDAVSDVFETVGDAVSDVGKAVESVGQAVGDVAESVAKDPIPVLVSVAAQTIGIPAPLTAAAITAAKGGSIEDIAKSAAISYVAQEVGQEAGSFVREAAPALQNIVPTAAQSATTAALSGRDVLSSALGGAVAGGVTGELAPSVGIGGDVARALGQTAGGIVAGVDPAMAAAAGITSAGMSQLSNAAKDIYQAVTSGNEPVTAQTEYAPLASGGVASDVSPTPLVRLPQREGTVTVQQDFTPMPAEGMGGPRTDLEQAAFESFSPADEFEYQEQLRQADIAAQRALPTQTGFQPIISPVDQQVFDLLVSGMGIRSDGRPGQAAGTQERTPAQVARDISTGVTSPRADEGTGAGRGTGGGTIPSGDSMIGGMIEEGGTGGGATTGGQRGGETAGTGGTGTGEGGGATPVSESMMRPMTIRAPAERSTLARTLGTPQSDSLLGALLGTALTPAGSTEPIMGEDESQRRAVWNLESLRNALGI